MLRDGMSKEGTPDEFIFQIGTLNPNGINERNNVSLSKQLVTFRPMSNS